MIPVCILLIHFCAPDDCGHGHMKLPVGQNKVMHWNEFVYLSMILCIIGKQTTSTYMIVYFLYSMLNIIPYCIHTINSYIKVGCFYLKYRDDLQLLYTFWNQSGWFLEANIGRLINMHLVLYQQTVFGFVHLANDIFDKFSFSTFIVKFSTAK